MRDNFDQLVENLLSRDVSTMEVFNTLFFDSKAEKLARDEIQHLKEETVKMAESALKSYMQGCLCHIDKEYNNAIGFYEAAIRLSHAGAMFNRAVMYRDGLGGQVNYAAARNLFERATDLGNAHAINQLAFMYLEGRSGTKNHKEARDLFEQAIALNHIDYDAITKLGLIYRDGFPPFNLIDYRRAIELFNQAANNQNTEAMTYLGFMYLEGIGCKQNYSKAIQLFDDACNRDNPEAMNYRGLMHLEGKGGPQNYAEALKLFRDAADRHKNTNAMSNLGCMYLKGYGCKQDDSIAIELFEPAIKKLNVEAMTYRGLMHLEGKGGPTNYSEAMRLFAQAEASNHRSRYWNADAIVYRGLMHLEGKGGPTNYSEAFRLFKYAAHHHKNANAMYYLGRMHLKGYGCKKDYSEAFEIFGQAVALDDADVMYNIGRMYQTGDGDGCWPQDYSKAIEFHEKAMGIHHHLGAILALADMYEQGLGSEKNSQKATELRELVIAIGVSQELESKFTVRDYQALTADEAARFQCNSDVIPPLVMEFGAHFTLKDLLVYMSPLAENKLNLDEFRCLFGLLEQLKPSSILKEQFKSLNKQQYSVLLNYYTNEASQMLYLLDLCESQTTDLSPELLADILINQSKCSELYFNYKAMLQIVESEKLSVASFFALTDEERQLQYEKYKCKNDSVNNENHCMNDGNESDSADASDYDYGSDYSDVDDESASLEDDARSSLTSPISSSLYSGKNSSPRTRDDAAEDAHLRISQPY